MLRILSILLLTVGAVKVWAEDLSVIDVRRNITLADDDPVYKDFYLAGATGGLKKNLVVTAIRKISVRDASGAQAFGEIQVPVGQLRVIAVYGKLAVAREYKLLSRDELPMLEQIGIMTGDKIDLQGSFVDNKPPVKPKRHVSEITPIPTLTVAVATTPAPLSTGTSAAPAEAPATVGPATAPGAPVGLPPVPITTLKTPAETVKGPAPASVAPAQPVPLAAPMNSPPPAAVVPTSQKLEKSMNSGDNTAL